MITPSVSIKPRPVPAKMLSLLALILITQLLSACGSEKFGAGVDPAAPLVTVQNIFLQPQLLNQKVTVQGIVFTQCVKADGCWLVLQDGTAQLYIDFSTNNFRVPPMRGRRIQVTGIVTAHQHGILLIAQGVETR